MNKFYKNALLKSLALVALSILAAYICLTRSILEVPLLPYRDSPIAWHPDAASDRYRGGSSTVTIDSDLERLRFSFNVTKAVPYPYIASALMFEDNDRKPKHVDLSRYNSISFYVRCTPANTLSFSIATFDPAVTKLEDLGTYRQPTTFFKCRERRMRVDIDLAKLETPEWWFQMLKVDVSQKAFRLDQVLKIIFSNSFQSPAETPSVVEISDLTLVGRDYRYMGLLAALLISGWAVHILLILRNYSSALIEDVKNKLKLDLPIIAYQQLSIESYRDKEKATVMAFIGKHYTDAELGMDMVVENTGVNRNKINDILKSDLGFTFIGYLNKLRLAEAARLLSEEDVATVSEIAYSVGYSSASYFSKLFKEEYGCTPKAFRDACK